MKFIASIALLGAMLMPAAPASAMTVAESAAVLQAITAEFEMASAQLAYLQGNPSQYVAGATTDTGLVAYVNGEETLHVSSANTFAVAKEICYVFATDYLISGDDYTCEFDGKLIFDSATDA